ncbi:MAG: transglycosylase domain-containing protein, partial [Omnitrophica WOR_2 bacterium]
MSENPANYPEEPPSERFRRLTKSEEEQKAESGTPGAPASPPEPTSASNDDPYSNQGLTQAWSNDEEESGLTATEGQETGDQPEDNQPPSQFVSLYPEIRQPYRRAQPPEGETRPAKPSLNEKPTVPSSPRGQGANPKPGQDNRSENKTHSIYTHPTVPSSSGIEKTPPRGMPALGTQGMPLPRRVDEIDMDATRVAPSAYSSAPRYRPAPVPAQTSAHIARPVVKPRRNVNWRQGFGCVLRMVILGLFALVLLALLGGTFILYQYYSIAATLPSVEDLRQRASQFETTRILDRNGNVLYEILDPKAGRRTYIKLNRISPFLIAATIATEDKEYYSHPGFDPAAIVRAFYQNTQGGNTVVSGASTITQQLARALLFTPEERVEQSYMRKVREAILAAEITRRYSKDEILELYLNEIYYGNMAYGIEAAAETYFGT